MSVTMHAGPVHITSTVDHYDRGEGDRVQTSQAREMASMASRSTNEDPRDSGSIEEGSKNKRPKKSPGKGRSKSQDKFVRLSVNLSFETAETFRELIARKGMSITEGIRRAIAVWKFIEDEKSRGNEIAVIEQDDTVRKVILL